MYNLVARWLSLAMLLSSQGLALAEDAPEDTLGRAQEFYLEGKEYYESGQLEKAMEAFTQSYNMSGEVSLLYNLGVLAEQLGELERAIAYYGVYLDELPDAPDVEEVRMRMERLQAGPAPSEQTAAEVGDEELQAVKEIPPDENKDISARDYYAEEPKEKRPSVFWPGVAVGLGGLLMAGGVLTGILAKTEYDKLRSSCAPDCSNDEVSKAKGLALATDFEFAFGALAAVTGAVFWILDSKKKKGEESRDKGLTSWRAAPVGLLDSPGLIIQGRF